MIEPAEGIFVGELPASVRDEVWQMISQASDVGRASLIYPTNSEQGFSVLAHGESRRNMRDFDGMFLVDYV
jgi:CRISPR-associated protein Cas2